jgi:hypothetical protein
MRNFPRPSASSTWLQFAEVRWKLRKQGT